MKKWKLLVLGSSSSPQRQLMDMLKTMQNLSYVARTEVSPTEIAQLLEEYRIDIVLLEYAESRDSLLLIEYIHRWKNTLPVLLYAANPGFEMTRTAFMIGAVDLLKVSTLTASSFRQIIQNAIEYVPLYSTAIVNPQTQAVKKLIRRGKQFERNLAENHPPAFYLNGNRSVLLYSEIVCRKPDAVWMQECAWEWTRRFGENNSYLLTRDDGCLHLCSVVEQSFVNEASFRTMLTSRLEDYFRFIDTLFCVATAIYCSSDYISAATMRSLEDAASQAFYLEKSEILTDRPSRRHIIFPNDLFTDYSTAIARRDLDAAVGCVDRAVAFIRKARLDRETAVAKLEEFVWRLASLLGEQEHRPTLKLDTTHILHMRETLVRIIEQGLADVPSEEPSSPMDELIRYIETYPGVSINIDQAAEKVNFSRSHFCRLFRQKTGLSFTEFVTSNRFRKACDLLEKTSMKVDEVAELIGISNTWYFKKLFEKQLGVTVEEWIEQNRSKQESSQNT